MSKNVFKLTPPIKAIKGEVFIPGSKSYTNRALILAALAPGISEIVTPSLSDDSVVLLKALRKFGIEVEQQQEHIRVHGRGINLDPFRGEINVGAAGTSMRFLVSLCAFVPGCEVTLLGSARMHERPIADLVDGLRNLGAKIEYLGKDGCPPLKINGISVAKASKVQMRGDLSSQYFSSLLLSATLLEHGLEIEVVGEQISRSYIDMTISSLKAFGVEVENNQYRSYRISAAQELKATRYQVEGDASGASYFWGLAAISGGTVRTLNINPNSAQGDVKFPQVLRDMGCSVMSGEQNGVGWIEVTGKEKLKGIEVDMELMPDTAQTLAVIAVKAESPLKITGLSTLRIKETDRIQALINELAKLGISADCGPDWIKVTPSQLRAGRIATYDDHRMAMSFAMLGSILPGIEIEEPEVVSKSFPDFWDKLSSFGITVES